MSTPEGIVGNATLADPEKAKPGLNAIMNYMEKLINDIVRRFKNQVDRAKMNQNFQGKQGFSEREVKEKRKIQKFLKITAGSLII